MTTDTPGSVKTSEPKRIPKTITMREDYFERLRDQAHKEKIPMSFLIERALERMWATPAPE